MCGIAGIFDGNRSLSDADYLQVDAMLNAQIHRGPDAAGTVITPHIALGHRRLSIIDLSDAGQQPMANETGTVQIVFNGEIYNYLGLRSELSSRHHFRSHSDTEVLVHGYEEWGISGLLQRLCGMFAFALTDCSRPSEPILYLVRDRLGIKPLYIYQSGGRSLFASEVRALLTTKEAAWTINFDAMAGFLAQGSVPAPATYVTGISSVKPAHYLTVSRTATTETRYWTLRHQHITPNWKETLSSLLPEVIRQHLVSDVPLGLFLSGGVDSTSLAALVSRVRPERITSLTLGFNEPEFNEAPAARRSATKFNTLHQETMIDCNTFMDHIPRFLASCDQPTSDGINTYFVSLATQLSGLKVVLSGLGGDELFLGYSHYRRIARSASLSAALEAAPRFLSSLLGRLPALYGTLSGKENWQRFGFVGNLPFDDAQYYLYRGFFPERQIAQLLQKSSAEVYHSLTGLTGLLSQEQCSEKEALNRFHHIEMTCYLHDQLLRDSDVFSMAHSIELRVPLLDHRLVELAAGIPVSKLLRRGMNKPCLVDAVNDALVTEFSRSEKRGFTFPFHKWMRKRADHLEPLALTGRVVDPAVARRLWQQFRAGRLHWSRAWALVVVETLAANLSYPDRG